MICIMWYAKERWNHDYTERATGESLTLHRQILMTEESS